MVAGTKSGGLTHTCMRSKSLRQNRSLSPDGSTDSTELSNSILLGLYRNLDRSRFFPLYPWNYIHAKELTFRCLHDISNETSFPCVLATEPISVVYMIYLTKHHFLAYLWQTNLCCLHDISNETSFPCVLVTDQSLYFLKVICGRVFFLSLSLLPYLPLFSTIVTRLILQLLIPFTSCIILLGRSQIC